MVWCEWCGVVGCGSSGPSFSLAGGGGGRGGHVDELELESVEAAGLQGAEAGFGRQELLQGARRQDGEGGWG